MLHAVVTVMHHEMEKAGKQHFWQLEGTQEMPSNTSATQA